MLVWMYANRQVKSKVYASAEAPDYVKVKMFSKGIRSLGLT